MLVQVLKMSLLPHVKKISKIMDFISEIGCYNSKAIICMLLTLKNHHSMHSSQMLMLLSDDLSFE